MGDMTVEGPASQAASRSGATLSVDGACCDGWMHAWMDGWMEPGKLQRCTQLSRQLHTRCVEIPAYISCGGKLQRCTQLSRQLLTRCVETTPGAACNSFSDRSKVDARHRKRYTKEQDFGDVVLIFDFAISGSASKRDTGAPPCNAESDRIRLCLCEQGWALPAY